MIRPVRAMLKLPGEPVKEIETDTGLHTLQQQVAGLIAMPWALDLTDEHQVQMVVNDDGLALRLAPCLRIDYGLDGMQTIVGPVIFLGTSFEDDETGDHGTHPLTDAQAAAVRVFCERWEV